MDISAPFFEENCNILVKYYDMQTAFSITVINCVQLIFFVMGSDCFSLFFLFISDLLKHTSHDRRGSSLVQRYEHGCNLTAGQSNQRTDDELFFVWSLFL